MKEACKKDEKPIEEIALQQNIPKNMREWNFTKEGKANKSLFAVICRYIQEAINRDTGKMMSSKVLATHCDLAESSVGKLIMGKQYMGGHALKEYKETLGAAGKEVPIRKS